MKGFRYFRIQLIAAFLLMAIVPVLLAAFYYYNTSKEMLLQSHKDALYQSTTATSSLYSWICGTSMDRRQLKKELTRLSDPVSAGSNLSVFPLVHQSEKARIYRSWRSSVYRYVYQFEIKSKLLEGAHSAYLYFPEAQLLLDSGTTYYENMTPEALAPLFELSQLPAGGTWQATNKLSYYRESRQTVVLSPEKYISFICPLYRDGENSPYAVAVLNLDPSIFEQISSKEEYNPDGSFIIYQSQGVPVYGGEDLSPEALTRIWDAVADGSTDAREIQLEAGPFLIEASQLEDEFIMVQLLSTAKVLDDLTSSNQNIIPIFLIIAAVFSIIAYYFAQRIYRPLDVLTKNMGYVTEGDLSKRITVTRNDEYGQVYSCYNQMLDRINSLLENITNEKLLRAEAEIFLLQEQVNPHFIYNSMEIIYSLAILNRTSEIPKLTKALSDFYRMCLSGGSMEVPVQSALEICDKYILIQNTRFMDKIHYSTAVEEGLEQYLIPKYAIQILVENAVVHGIEPLLRPGHVHTSVQREGDTLVVAVQDDGVGISKEKIHEIYEQFRSNATGSRNFALCNLHRQIVLKYGNMYGVKLSQLSTGGTRSEIRLPCIK